VFVDFPLGHTAGKPNDPRLQREIVRSALAAFVELEVPGAMKMTSFRWSASEGWKHEAMRGGDARTARSSRPVYQSEADRALAEAAGDCSSCVFL